jgi:2-polyprenyl-6-methoxyphenol hydroxylase-like FAD-dependent oxidoreductase
MKAVVVGAGPAGAATALLLARAGVEVALLERERSSERVFRGEGLMPSGVDALYQMGLGEALESVPNRTVRSWHIWIDGQEVFTIPEPLEELGHKAMRVINHPALLDRIVGEASRFPSFRIERGARVTDLLRDGAGRVCGVRARTAAGERDEPADLVLGADGRGSQVRRLAGIGLGLDPEQYDVLWCKLPAPERLPDDGRTSRMLIMVAAGKDPALCYTAWDGRLQYGLVRPKGTRRATTAARGDLPEPGPGAALDAVGDSRSGDWIEEAVQSAPGWLADHARVHRHQVEGPVRLNVVVGRAKGWTVPGVLLLGDAAHPMSPVRAQGINLALRDAIVAANHVLPAAAGGAAWDAACRAVQREREPEVVRSQALQRLEAAGQGDARSASWRFALARRVAPVIGRYRWAQQLWLKRQHGLRHGIADVRLQRSL